MNLYVTLAELKEMEPRPGRYLRLMHSIEYDEDVPDKGVRIPLELIYEVNGPGTFEWVIRMMRSTKGVRRLGLRVLNSPGWNRYLYCPRHSERQGRAVRALCRKFQREG